MISDGWSDGVVYPSLMRDWWCGVMMNAVTMDQEEREMEMARREMRECGLVIVAAVVMGTESRDVVLVGCRTSSCLYILFAPSIRSNEESTCVVAAAWLAIDE
jgi:hypothetical protein